MLDNIVGINNTYLIFFEWLESNYILSSGSVKVWNLWINFFVPFTRPNINIFLYDKTFLYEQYWTIPNIPGISNKLLSFV